MMKCYTDKKFNAEHKAVIDNANRIIAEYARQGFDLTLRQLYYQFVSRAWLDNNDKKYKWLGGIISDARRAGLIDWNAIVDRTRFLRHVNFWESPAALVESCATQYAVDFWKDQKCRPEVWVEKDALVGVIEVACAKWKCPYFSCRGYTSDSEVWGAAQRLDGYDDEGYKPIIFHLGDHDPSGIDMSRDIDDRLFLFSGAPSRIEVVRIALTFEQVEKIGPPPNPAKITDSRFSGYKKKYGDESWELDALSPTYIADLIADEMVKIIDPEAWEASKEAELNGRAQLQGIADNYESIISHM